MQLVLVRAGHDRHQLGVTGPVEPVARRLKCYPGGLALVTGERMLSLADDQPHRLPDISHSARSASVSVAPSIVPIFFMSNIIQLSMLSSSTPADLGVLVTIPRVLLQLGGYSVYDQHARVSALVAPRVYMDDYAASLLQGRTQFVFRNVDLPVGGGAARNKPFDAPLNGFHSVKSATRWSASNGLLIEGIHGFICLYLRCNKVILR